MLTPHDWQEGMGNRSAFVNERLSGGMPVVAVATLDGILMLTLRRQSRKIYEIYDRLAYGAIGQQSDIEQLRVAAIDFAHQEGFQRSENDVTIKRVVAGLSQPLKRAFADFNTTPFVVRSLFAEVCKSPETDSFFVLDFDGDYSLRRGYAYVAGNEDTVKAISEALAAEQWAKYSAKIASPKLEAVLAKGLDPTGTKSLADLAQGLIIEVGILHRTSTNASRFETLAGGEEGSETC